MPLDAAHPPVILAFNYEVGYMPTRNAPSGQISAKLYNLRLSHLIDDSAVIFQAQDAPYEPISQRWS